MPVAVPCMARRGDGAAPMTGVFPAPEILEFYGEPGWDRTIDARIKSPTLYH